MGSTIAFPVWEGGWQWRKEIEIERKNKRVEDKDLGDSKCNKGKMKNILTGKFWNHSFEVNLHNAQKRVRNRKGSVKIYLEIRNVSLKWDSCNNFVIFQEDQY